jgi:hypothetical protein
MVDWHSFLNGGETWPEDWWFRVFGTNHSEPEPAAILQELQRLGFEVTGRFRGDDQGWFSAEIAYDPGRAPLLVERYLSTEENIRSDLNAWAAWLETHEHNPHAHRLMEHMIQTTQLFTLHDINPSYVKQEWLRFNQGLCKFLAKQTEGVYQMDHVGFFATDGTLLIRKEDDE